jgi:hypothetical protein
MNQRLLFLLMLILIIVSCEKRNAPFTDTPVIESYLSPGEHPVVKISRQIPFSSDTEYSSDDVNSLDIRLISENSSHTLTNSAEGIYTDSTIAIGEQEYELSFVFNSKNVSASTSVPYKPENFIASDNSISVTRMTEGSFGQMGSFQMPEPLYLTWDNNDNSYYLVVIECLESVLDPVREFNDSIPAGNMFRKTPVTSQGIEIRPQEFQYFGRHRIILFHVLPDYASLYDEKVSSSQNLTNPSTSIKNGYGIFTGLNSDTLFIQVNEAAR